jgi:hypothetical protein
LLRQLMLQSDDQYASGRWSMMSVVLSVLLILANMGVSARGAPVSKSWRYGTNCWCCSAHDHPGSGCEDGPVLLGLLSRIWTGWRTALVIVKPETVIAWHRRGFRLWWTWKSRHRIGRPAMPADIRTLIRTMAQANPRWGAPRIHGELLKLGIEVCQATVAKYSGASTPASFQTWRTFLRNHIGQIVAADFFVVPTVTYRLLFVLVLLGHDRRRIRHIAVTAAIPTATWTAPATASRLFSVERGTSLPPTSDRESRLRPHKGHGEGDSEMTPESSLFGRVQDDENQTWPTVWP